MTTLLVLPEDRPDAAPEVIFDSAGIAARLAADGVRFERWAVRDVPAVDDVLSAYADEVKRISEAEGFIQVDVASLHPDPTDPEWPAKAAAARSKFLEEHTHDDGEVRFFVDGRGAFYLRLGGKVLIVICEAGDLISVPADTRHWFDMGTNPSFTAIRFFLVEEGWVGRFTGDPIASRFPRLDDLVASSAS
jgi:1,2-dihydroxy-3-keto-5-methylthiopentene dioxygenase